MPIDRVRVLHGHTDQASAYLVDDYPYGFRLRCKIRYWVETAVKGSAKGQTRFMSQTTNPKVVGEVWNKPKGSTYATVAVMFLDGDDRVQWTGVDSHLSPVQDARLRLMGIVDQLGERDRALYEFLLIRSRQYQRQWDEFNERVDMITEHLRNGGEFATDNGMWSDSGRPVYLFGEPEVFEAVARERIDQEVK